MYQVVSACINGHGIPQGISVCILVNIYTKVYIISLCISMPLRCGRSCWLVVGGGWRSPLPPGYAGAGAGAGAGTAVWPLWIPVEAPIRPQRGMVTTRNVHGHARSLSWKAWN